MPGRGDGKCAGGRDWPCGGIGHLAPSPRPPHTRLRMRPPNVADVCDPGRSVVGTFRPTADGVLTLEECETLPPGAADGVQPWRAIAERRPRGARVVVVAPAAGTLVKSLGVPRLRRAQRERVVRFEAAQAIPRPLAETAWDWAPVADDAGAVELSAMKLETAEALCAEAERGGVRVDAIVSQPTALLRAFRYNHPERCADSPVLLQVDGELALLVRSTGGDIAVRLVGVPPAEAAADSASEAGGLRERRLVAELQRLVRGAGRAGESNSPTTVWISGTTPPDAAKLGKLPTAVPFEFARFDPHRRLKSRAALPVASDAAGTLALLTGAALALVGPRAPNLLPEPRRREQAFRRRRVRRLAACATGLLLIWGAVAAFERATARAEAAAGQLTRELAPWREHQRAAAARRRELDACHRELAVLDKLSRAQPGWARFFNDAQHRCARVGAVWLETVQYLPPGAPRRPPPG